ncbi:hypothetical protein A15E_02107 [Escherichia coli KTE202]|nr:hypothetical protein A15E_02107 [Escherichia coli KTE202]ELI56407.1 hypothetical protein WIO_01544 [Escherichia coli KTE125]
MGQFRQLVGSGATYLNGFAQNIGISIIQRSDLLTFMGNDSNLLIVFYVQIMPDDFVMQLHRF